MIFILWFTYKRTKVAREEELHKNDFWNNEQKANSTRKQDISNLDYIHIPIDELPFLDTDDEVLLECQNSITSLSNETILNLTGKSNTELNLEYGPANFTVLNNADQNFTRLAQTIYKWGARLLELDYNKEAICVLEFGIKCKSDISKNYTLLASLYKNNGSIKRIDSLIAAANTLNSLMKNSIIESLKKISSPDNFAL